METLLEGEEMGIKSVEQDKEPAVLDPMMAVLQKLLYALNGDIVSVLHTNLEIQSVVLDLIIMEGEEPLVELELELELVLVLKLVLEKLKVLKQKLVEEHLEDEKQ